MLWLVVLVAAVPGAASRPTSAQQAPAPAAPAPHSPSPQAAPATPAPATPAQESAPPPQTPAPAVESNADLRADAWKLLKQGAASEKTRDRSDAISALALLDQSYTGISLIAAGLKDKETNIRVLAAASLGDMKARSAIPQLKDAMDDDSPEVSFAATQALWKIGDRSGRRHHPDQPGERECASGCAGPRHARRSRRRAG